MLLSFVVVTRLLIEVICTLSRFFECFLQITDKQRSFSTPDQSLLPTSLSIDERQRGQKDQGDDDQHCDHSWDEDGLHERSS